MTRPLNLLTGQAGVFRVASELLVRGINAFLPAVDTGVDLLTDKGTRIQVKSAHARRHKSVKGLAYTYHLGYIQRGAAHKPKRRPFKFSEECDFLVFWGIDEDRFWVVPAHACDNRHIVMLGMGRARSGIPNCYTDTIYQSEDRWDHIEPVPDVAEGLVLRLAVAGGSK